MDLLVIGGAGFIGSVVAGQLLAAGHRVTVYDNLVNGHRAAIPDGADFVHGDVLDLDTLTRTLSRGFDGVFHFAALSLVGESVAEPGRYFRTNIGGTVNVVEAMRATGVNRLVFSSTAAVYGIPDCVPIPETAPLRPISPYGASKLAVDTFLGFAAEAYGLGAVSLRYFNVAGAWDRFGEDHRPETHLIPLALQVALGRRPHLAVFGNDYPTPDGTCIRDYLHVEDLGVAHQLALAAADSGTHRIYNLGNGAGFSVREVIETARRVTGHPIPTVEAPRRAGDPPVLVASSERIREELGWQPRKPDLETIIADAWAWMQAHPQGYPDE
ncbi:UDP-glucose 4-epimerase GalE [Sphaerobacter sp.]|uniref:UDP-glucose 4-epimerase GalE n=1 Tax=Sphaerobacter sp. TaxID=2099654 RepID=UPI001D789E14|nr:UDP-glucose 4-epimerase GalE [Sphaerobacter sp.]MBX5445795.1 UDP-glucose 4-epimerase GalE [Sphaerobacter sp.]